MRMALVDVNYGSSSTGKILLDLQRGLSGKGHIVKSFFGRGSAKDASKHEAVKISSDLEVAFHALATRITGFTDGFSPISTKRLLRELENFQPDLVHLHDIHGYFVDIPDVCRFLQRKGIPTVWTFHSEFMYTGRCGYAMECQGWTTGCPSCPDLARYPKTWFFDFADRMLRQKQAIFSDFQKLQLVAPSAWLADRMRKSIVKDKPIEVVPNGLDTSVFRPHEAQDLKAELQLEGLYCVVTVGADLMSDRKGGRWVLEMAKRFEGEDVVFVMVGVDQLLVPPPNVRFLPRCDSQEELVALYSLGDIFLLPSQKETFSMVCAEALACGLPVIGFDSGAPKEVAPNGYGSFVPYPDVDALESLLRSARKGEADLSPAEACVEFARARYSRATMVASYEAIYERTVEKA